MMQTAPMTKDLMFKMRLDEQDKKRLDALAEHYSAPAATVVRILVKEKFDDVETKKARGEEYSFEFKDHHRHVIRAVDFSPTSTKGNAAPVTKEQIWENLEEVCHRATEAPPNLTNALVQLHRGGYVRRTRSGYVLTDEGKRWTTRRR